MSAQPLLEVRGLTQRFGGVVALDAVDLSVEPGRTVGLIGPNGAGKTTLFNCVTGVQRPTRGDVWFGGETPERLTGLAPHHVAQRGITRTFQNIRLFAGMSVLENVVIGTYLRTHTGILSASLLTHEARREQRWARDHAMGLLEFVGLTGSAGKPAGSLPFGFQRRLELARALASDPAMVLLDEPAAGLNPSEKQQLLGLLAALKARGLTMILIEHDMQVVMPVSDRVVVLDYGKKIAEGLPGAIQADPRVIEAYLGTPRSIETLNPEQR